MFLSISVGLFMALLLLGHFVDSQVWLGERPISEFGHHEINNLTSFELSKLKTINRFKVGEKSLFEVEGNWVYIIILVLITAIVAIIVRSVVVRVVFKN